MNRPNSSDLNALLGVAHPVHRHGFVRVVDYMGNDATIARAARVSYGRHNADRGAEADRRLIRYLMSHRHTSPFEMCAITLHVKAPIFVARQWLRHRMANVNEVSARYTTLPAEVYVPSVICGPATDNKQGRGAPLPTEDAEDVADTIRNTTWGAVDWVGKLTDGDGSAAVAPEIARMVGPLNQYTEWVWKIDLHNLLHFLALRMDSHAQLEIRDYANVIAEIVAGWVPMSWEAFRDYRLNAITLSAGQAEAMRRMLRGVPTKPEDVGLTPREWADLQGKFGGER